MDGNSHAEHKHSRFPLGRRAEKNRKLLSLEAEQAANNLEESVFMIETAPSRNGSRQKAT